MNRFCSVCGRELVPYTRGNPETYGYEWMGCPRRVNTLNFYLGDGTRHDLVMGQKEQPLYDTSTGERLRP